MPKFLDVPSWYDENGTLTTFIDSASIQIGGKQGSSIYVPVTKIEGSTIQQGNIPKDTWTVQESDERNCVLLSNISYGTMWSPAPTEQYSALTYRRNVVAWEPLPKLYAHTGRMFNITASWTVRGNICYNYYSANEEKATTFSELSNALYTLWGTAYFTVSGWIRIAANDITYPTYAMTASSSGALNIYYTDGTNSLQNLSKSITSSDHFSVTEVVTELF